MHQGRTIRIDIHFTGGLLNAPTPSSPMPYLRHLLALGPRPIGSPANQAAADFIRDAFQALGYDVEEQPYDCIYGRGYSAELTVAGQPAEAEPNPFSLPCNVTGQILPIGSLAELESTEFSGRILLLYGDLASVTLSPKAWFLKTERDERIIQRLESGQPAAVLAPPALSHERMPFSLDWELQVAAATVPVAILARLLRDPSLEVSLRIRGQRIPAQARNIVARSKPTQSGQRVVLCAHFDTMNNTPGATDNAAGVAALLALAAELRDEPLPFQLELIAFNGEEYLPIGDDEYLRRAGDSLDRILFALNIDGAGPLIASTSIMTMAASSAFQAGLEALTAVYPGVVWVEPWPESNHSTFAMRGVPAIAIGSVGARFLAHTPADDLEAVSPQKLDEVCRLAAAIVRSRPVDCRDQ